MSKVIYANNENFASEVESYSGRVLVDFFAEWCGPCKMISPLVDQLAEDEPELKVVKVDADQAPEIMAKYGIRGIPTLLVFEGGELKGTKVGALPAGELKNFALSS